VKFPGLDNVEGFGVEDGEAAMTIADEYGGGGSVEGGEVTTFEIFGHEDGEGANVDDLEGMVEANGGDLVLEESHELDLSTFALIVDSKLFEIADHLVIKYNISAVLFISIYSLGSRLLDDLTPSNKFRVGGTCSPFQITTGYAPTCHLQSARST
jgi:hypothetical protein